MRESGPLKRGEEGDEYVGEDGDVDEDDRREDGSPGGTSAPPGERGREVFSELCPTCFPHSRLAEVRFGACVKERASLRSLIYCF